MQQVKVQEGSRKSLFLKVKRTPQKHHEKKYCLMNKMDSLSQNLWMTLEKILCILFTCIKKKKPKQTQHHLPAPLGLKR